MKTSSDCLYCPGGGPCHYNHVEAGTVHSRQRKPTPPLETMVDRPLIGTVASVPQHQRFSAYEMQRSVLR